MKGRNSGGAAKSAGGTAQKGSAITRGAASTLPTRQIPSNKKPGHYRSASKIRLLQMYNSKPKWLRPGGKEPQPLAPARIQPDRRWFGNTRVIDQQKLAAFREDIQKATADPYTVVLKRSKLPMSLIKDRNVGGKKEAVTTGGQLPKLSGDALVALEPFEGVFGSKKTRKRPRLQAADLTTLATQAAEREAAFEKSTASSSGVADNGGEGGPVESIYQKGTSRRIWGELYKVIDASDVLVQVVDARDPMGTRCTRLERYLKAQRSSKHLVLVINKVDLVPPRVARHWLRQLSKEMPTLLMQADKNKKNIGRNQLFQLLRQYGQLLSDRKHVSIGFFGYPNVGKSSIINFLKSKQVCKAAPIPGQTRVWQYVALTSKLYLIDCPGIVPISSDAGNDTDKVMRGVVRPERINAPEEHIGTVLERVKREAVITRYGLDQSTTWEDAEEFLSLLAVRLGKLKRGGEPDISTAARIMLYDLQRGKLPYYVLPPGMASEAAGVALDDSEVQLNGALAFPEGISPVLTDVTHKSSKHDEEEPAILGDDCGTQDAKSNETVETDAAVLEPPSSECVCGPNKRAKTMSSNSG
ncbi:nucleolar GTP-binding protein NOG2, putative [Eimeria maxima]|uniref:Nucleolar GTP-binding protein 2 n=1 Tax=Eimeria maxima TaxID=5804 RepID=U6M7K9_EIMMA|nr:nucleolar GTP-binding protein NOG2, putative [Eimeria maxima]CDJ58464.1 nucleolar GTP-binding protein NOG2, putative [Eimeria maxima]